MSKEQNNCRTISWAFSIVSICCYSLLSLIFIIFYVLISSTSLKIVEPYGDVFQIKTIKSYMHIYMALMIVFILLTLVSVAFLILNAKARKDEQYHITLGVCQIIFGNLVSGILMLCSGGKEKIKK